MHYVISFHADRSAHLSRCFIVQQSGMHSVECDESYVELETKERGGDSLSRKEKTLKETDRV